VTAVAVGVFDGVHLGHKALLERARMRAQGGRSIAVSFEPHPDIVLAREFRPLAPLTPLPGKHARFAALGVELHVLPFTRELAALEPEVFVDEYLVQPFSPRWLVVGEDFALGRKRAGNVSRLREIGAGAGFEVDALPLLMQGDAPVTSTRIRGLLAEGRVAEVTPLLGGPYTIAGRVVGGDKIGRTLGFPTANLQLHDEQLVPGNGIYAVWARIGEDPEWRMGAMSIGVRPTFGGVLRTIEVFLLEYSGDLYGQSLTIAFADWLRGEEKFAGVEPLVAQMHRDVAEARVRLASGALPAK
jgi:riboflavin kinase/FMN adenylyltransferase